MESIYIRENVLLYLSTVLFCWCIIFLTIDTVALGSFLEAFTRVSVVSFLESCCLLLDLWDFLYWKHLRRKRALNNASLVVLRISAALKSINEQMKFKYINSQIMWKKILQQNSVIINIQKFFSYQKHNNNFKSTWSNSIHV